MALKWDGIQEGDTLPELRKKPGVTQLVKYAAGGGDFNPLHHDYAFPQAKALGSIIVHGRFKYASLGELVSNWLDHGGRIRKLSCQYRGMDMVDKDVTCKGLVTATRTEDGRNLVDLQVWTEDPDGNKTTPGTATVALPSRSGSGG